MFSTWRMFSGLFITHTCMQIINTDHAKIKIKCRYGSERAHGVFSSPMCSTCGCTCREAEQSATGPEKICHNASSSDSALSAV